MLYADPAAAHALFEKLTRAAIVQIEEQIAAGAEAAQIFESWLGELDRYDLEEFSFPYLARIAEAVRKAGVPVIFFAHRHGRAPRADRAARLRRRLGRLAHADRGRARPRSRASRSRGTSTRPCCSGRRRSRSSARARIVRAAGPKPGYIFNLGHGLQPADADREREGGRGRGPRLHLEVRRA